MVQSSQVAAQPAAGSTGQFAARPPGRCAAGPPGHGAAQPGRRVSAAQPGRRVAAPPGQCAAGPPSRCQAAGSVGRCTGSLRSLAAWSQRRRAAGKFRNAGHTDKIGFFGYFSSLRKGASALASTCIAFVIHSHSPENKIGNLPVLYACYLQDLRDYI
jgi:hypothetical protein